ncbi:MAG TPA: AraC family transcriptional regulator [Opitutae bacterium]|nr:AraC family transcriptional regulator [Opitutaceae bacterium]MEC7907504.1 AraC family transcriptional regulator [Verrucomicrobiota bacterium]HCR29958.1 AraC family transcriptional regulator [Opitutae bacterium]
MRSFFELFEYHPTAYFHAKDRHHRYIYVNQLVLRDVFGMLSLDQVVGKTDLDFQPPALAEAYHAEDQRVMDGGRPIPNEVWLVPHVQGFPKWYVSTMTPLRCNEGNIVGTTGVMYPVLTSDDREAYFRELAPVISHIETHYGSDLSMKEMAVMAGLSSTQFNKRFRELLRMSPSEYILKLRIEVAQNLLNSSNKSIAEISAEAGFYDQSHFTKRFRKVTGMTPMAFRKEFH